MNKAETICRRIRIIKTMLGLEQAEFAKKLGITSAAVGNYMNDRVPKWDMLLKIVELAHEAGEYDITLDWIITGKKTKIINDNMSVAENPIEYELNEATEKIADINKVISFSPFHRNLFHEYINKSKQRTLFDALYSLDDDTMKLVLEIIKRFRSGKIDSSIQSD